jgi:hypothetical protein
VNEGYNGRPPVFVSDERDRMAGWAASTDIVITGLIGAGFDTDEIRVAKLDPTNGRVTLVTDADYPVADRMRYAFTNVFEELDQAGEYYIDKTSGILYLYPPKNLADATVQVSQFDKNFVLQLSNVSHVSFTGLTFGLSKGSIIRVLGGQSVTVDSCTFENYGVHGVHVGDYTPAIGEFVETYNKTTGSFNGDLWDETVNATEYNGVNHAILNSTFRNTGYRAAHMIGGSIGLREPSGDRFEGNTIVKSGLMGFNGFSGLTVDGVGFSVKNNYFAHTIGSAIMGNTVDTEITYNEFVDSPSDFGDELFAIYLNYLHVNDGVRIEYNYVHDVSRREPDAGRVWEGVPRGGIDFDGGFPEAISHNVFYNTPASLRFLSANTVNENIGNIVVDTQEVGGIMWNIPEVTEGTGAQFLTSHPYFKDWITSRIFTSQWLKDNYPESYEWLRYTYYDRTNMATAISKLENNLIVNIDVPMLQASLRTFDGATLDPKYGSISNNHFFDQDPGFANLRAGDLQLSSAAAAALGIEAIDMSKIGVPNPPTRTKVSSCVTVDPLADVRVPLPVQLENSFAPYTIIDFWREVTPGCWIWEEAMSNLDQGVDAFLKPGGTYTAYYHGDATHYPQFLGGLTGETPPPGVETFTISPTRQSTPGEWDDWTWDWMTLPNQLLTTTQATGTVKLRGANPPSGTVVEFREIVTTKDGHKYWDYTGEGHFPKSTTGTTRFTVSSGRFTATGLLPGHDYAVIARIPGHDPTWLGGYSGNDDLSAGDARVGHFTAPKPSQTYSLAIDVTN